MREISLIIIHCSATPPTMDIGADEIRKWHTGKGWSDIGYHYVIRRDGVCEDGRAEKRAGAHVKGFNSNSIGVCMIGGVDAEGNSESNFTAIQWDVLEPLICILSERYPDARITGHNDPEFNSGKDCPCFNVAEWWANEISERK